MQICQPKRGVGTWLLVWENPLYAHKIIRQKRCPDGCVPFTQQVVAAEVMTTGEFSGPAYMPTDDTTYRLRAMGFETKYSVAAAVTGVDDCLSLSEGSLLCACGFDELDLFTELFKKIFDASAWGTSSMHAYDSTRARVHRLLAIDSAYEVLRLRVFDFSRQRSSDV